MNPARLGLALVVCHAAACTDAAPAPDGTHATSDPRPADIIQAENALPGDSGWAIDSDDGAADFGAYARPLSVEPGGRLAVFASAPVSASASWSVYRLGWYRGTGGRRYASGGFRIAPQPPYDVDLTTGRVECHWNESFAVPIDAQWTPGYYLARIELPDGRARYAPFIVKDRRQAAIVAVLPTATDQAYNAWGGESLYVDSRGWFPIGHAYEVSYDRPLDSAYGAGASLASAGPALRWLEANGYDVTYVADQDVAADASVLTRGKLVMVLAHDEYWSRAMRDHYEQARAAGASLAFLGANIGFWQVRFAPAPDGLPDRRQVGYKEAATLDPLYGIDDADVTDAFAGPILMRPENALLGVRTLDWLAIDFAWAVKDASSWVYAGSGLDEGALLPGCVGLEPDGIVDNGATPAGIVAVAQSPTIGGDQSAIDLHQSTYYATGAGGLVFSAASIRFPQTLQGPRSVAGAQRIVANVIARATGRAAPAEALPAQATLDGADWSQAAASVVTVAGNGVAGYGDGPARQAQLATPLGIALAPDGSLVIADSGNHRIRRLDPPDAGDARALSTVAGAELPSPGTPLPPGTFRHAWGIAVAGDGTIWVGDPTAQRLTRIAPTGEATAFEGPSVGAPSGVAVAPDGTVWFTDVRNGVLRTVAADGTIALVPAQASDGGLTFPTGLTVDADGAWVVDSGHHAIRHLGRDGTLTTLAGIRVDTPFADGDGRAAALEPLLGIARLGPSLVVADAGNHRLRLVAPGADAAGTQVRSFAGRAAHLALTDGPGVSAELALPTGIAVDVARGVVYVADSGNAVIRALRP